jgi:hypothetical protein
MRRNSCRYLKKFSSDEIAEMLLSCMTPDRFLQFKKDSKNVLTSGYSRHTFYERGPMQTNNSEKRRHERRLFFDNIEYCSGQSSDDVCLGSGNNISDSGVCMWTFRGLSRGEDIDIVNGLPPPYRKATVRWVKRYSGDFYKVGLEILYDFSEPSYAGGSRDLTEHN